MHQGEHSVGRQKWRWLRRPSWLALVVLAVTGGLIIVALAGFLLPLAFPLRTLTITNDSENAVTVWQCDAKDIRDIGPNKSIKIEIGTKLHRCTIFDANSPGNPYLGCLSLPASLSDGDHVILMNNLRHDIKQSACN